MKKSILIVAAIAGFLLALVMALPARVLVYVLPKSVEVGVLSGSVWNGTADYLAINGRNLGTAKWALHPLHLLRGRLALDGELSSGEGQAKGWFSFGPGGTVKARNVDLRWPLADLPLGAVPPGWSGTIRAVLAELELTKSGPQSLLGTVDALDLRQASPEPLAIGSYRLVFDENSKQGDTWVGRLQDTGGPMKVVGTLTLSGTREFAIEGQVTPSPQAPPAIVNTLRFLGQPDAQGRRPFSLAGTY